MFKRHAHINESRDYEVQHVKDSSNDTCPAGKERQHTAQHEGQKAQPVEVGNSPSPCTGGGGEAYRREQALPLCHVHVCRSAQRSPPGPARAGAQVRAVARRRGRQGQLQSRAPVVASGAGKKPHRITVAGETVVAAVVSEIVVSAGFKPEARSPVKLCRHIRNEGWRSCVRYVCEDIRARRDICGMGRGGGRRWRPGRLYAKRQGACRKAANKAAKQRSSTGTK